jgi:hypothetical protein
MIAMLFSTSLGRTAILGLAVLLAVGGAFTGGFWKGWNTGNDGKAVAVRLATAERDTYWQQTLEKANAENEKAMQAALAAADRVPAVTGGKPELIRLCGSAVTNADCRSKDSLGVPGVQPPVVGH